jgi:hypothetical protein
MAAKISLLLHYRPKQRIGRSAGARVLKASVFEPVGGEYAHSFPQRKTLGLDGSSIPRKVRGRRESRVFRHTRSLACKNKKHTS